MQETNNLWNRDNDHDQEEISQTLESNIICINRTIKKKKEKKKSRRRIKAKETIAGKRGLYSQMGRENAL